MSVGDLFGGFDLFFTSRYNIPMARRAEFVPYRPKTILNKHKRPDHWFWTRYTAYPYKGCQHGCLFCYCREKKYAPHDDPNDFAYRIMVKENAPDLLRQTLSRAPAGQVGTGDYQPVERKFGLSRQMLEVCRDLGFPVLVLERSPLVLRDLDLLKDIAERATAMVMFSIISTPDSPHYDRVREMEKSGACGGEALCGHGADCQGRHTGWHLHDADLARPVR